MVAGGRSQCMFKRTISCNEKEQVTVSRNNTKWHAINMTALFFLPVSSDTVVLRMHAVCDYMYIQALTCNL